jgi:hypothetical protein
MSIRCVWLLILIVCIAASASAQTPAPAQEIELPDWVVHLEQIAAHSQDIFKLVATVASIIGTIIGIFAGVLTVRKNRAELEILTKRAAAAATAAVPVPSILTDPRLGMALLLAMDFVVATIITMLTHYALNFLARPFNTFGGMAYDVLQGIIVTALFWPIVANARRLKKMIVADPPASH